ncbi:MAG: lspA [Thermoleophilia bacterium]|nr:lspA [Thermoleophilia bacterium]
MDVGTTGRIIVAAGAVAAATVAVDQSSKAIAREHLPIGEHHDAAGGQLSLHHVQNTGGGYGAFGTLPAWAAVAATIGIGAGLVAMGRGSSHQTLAAVGAGLVVGGGVGNAIDRARDGSVTDFLHVTDAFGTFNAADVAITGGLVAAGAAIALRAH